MINFYRKIFRIFCRITDNPKGGQQGNFPQHMAFAGTAALCVFNLFVLFLLINSFVFKNAWQSGHKIYLLIIGLGVLIYFYFIFLYNDNYKKYIDIAVDNKKKTKENWFLGLYIVISLLLLVAVPIVISAVKRPKPLYFVRLNCYG